MDDAGAVVEGDVVGVDELTLDALVAEDRLLVLVVAKLGAGHAPGFAVGAADELDVLIAELGAVLLDEGLGHDLGAAVVDDGDVGRLGVQDDGVVGRQGPGGGGPDVDPELALPGLEARRHGGHLEAHEDGGADLVAVFDLGLGERRVAVRAPVDRLAAAVDGAAVVDGLEDLDVGGVVVVDVASDRGCPTRPRTPRRLKPWRWSVDLLDGHLAAELADLRRWAAG